MPQVISGVVTAVHHLFFSLVLTLRTALVPLTGLLPPRCAFTRHSPDDARTGVNSSDFLASQAARRELRAAIRTTGSPNGGRGVDLAIFPFTWDALLLSVALECMTSNASR